MAGYKTRVYCTCGASMQFSANPKITALVLEGWHRHHTGPGHAACDAETAQRARERRERERKLA